MKLSVVVPCFNNSATIAAQLEALASQHWTEPWEIIVSDNGSTDESPAIVARYQTQLSRLRVIDSSDRRGAAHARNAGAQAAQGEWLAFCDADDEVGPGWVAAIGQALAQHDFVASRFDIEKLNAPWVQRIHANPQQNEVQQYKYPPFLPHAGGSGLAVKRFVHEAVGGFDESMRLLEDTDYCWRIQLNGTPLHFVPEAVIHIRYRDNLKGTFSQACRWAEYNVLLYKKYRPLGMPELSWQSGLKGWQRLGRQLRRIRCRADYARWLWRFGWQFGRLRGSLKYRVRAL